MASPPLSLGLLDALLVEQLRIQFQSLIAGHSPMIPDCRVASTVRCAFGHLSSQYGEDLALLPTLLHLARTSPTGQGHFLEMGALDGVQFSNTLMVENDAAANGMAC